MNILTRDALASQALPDKRASLAQPDLIRLPWHTNQRAPLKLPLRRLLGWVSEGAMSKSLPYCPLYFGDFLRSTAGWTLIERGAYLMLLLSQWELGALPEDPARLAAILGADTVTFTPLWTVVGPKFKRTAAGLVNERMEEYRSNYLEYRRHQAESGRKGASVRWQKAGKVVAFPNPENRHG